MITISGTYDADIVTAELEGLNVVGLQLFTTPAGQVQLDLSRMPDPEQVATILTAAASYGALLED